MAEEEVVVAAGSPVLSDHKRKHDDLEPEAPEPLGNESNPNGYSVSDSEPANNTEEAVAGDVSNGSDAKRPRLEDKPDGLDAENGHEDEKVDEPTEEVAEAPPAEDNTQLGEMKPPSEEAPESETDKGSAADDHLTEGVPQPSDAQVPVEVKVEAEQVKVEHQEPVEGLQDLTADVPQQGGVSSVKQEPASDNQSVSRKMEVPNTKVGVLIGKAGDTIRLLQHNSGARIQIMRDAEADPYATTRPVELIGTLESISKAEKLIKDVIAEADAGGSPSLVARGFNTVQSVGAAEQIEMQVPNEKVGLIIGKGGETIKNLQTRTGARIQLIPQHLPNGDLSKERTVRVTGDKKQIEMAREMMNEVMNQSIRPSPLSSGYNQSGGRARGPVPSWGPRGTHPTQPTGYDYQQRGPPASQNPQYPPQTYGNYPPQQFAPRSNYGWEQRPQVPAQGGYDYYGGQVGQADAPPQSHYAPGRSMGPSHSQVNYNYGQPTPYQQNAPPAQSYGHGYNETSQPPMQQHPYGGHGGSQPSVYPQGNVQPGYGLQDQYGKPPPYGMPPQGAHAQPYGQPRSNQPGDVPYQGPISTPSYGPNVPAQQPYPYASSGPMQQAYPPYGSAPAADGYNHPPPATASTPGYGQQGGHQPASGYGQPGGQQAPAYAQVGTAGGYGPYASSQPGYTEQAAAPVNAGYGYQGPADPSYSTGPVQAYGAPSAGQPVYSQPPPTQPGYDQSIPQAGGYGGVQQGSVPVVYAGKSLSPQPGYPQYDASQMYAAPR